MKTYQCDICGFVCTLQSKQTQGHDFKPKHCPMQNTQKAEWIKKENNDAPGTGYGNCQCGQAGCCQCDPW